MESARVQDRSSDWPKASRSTVLSRDEEATIVAFWRHTLLPLGDVRNAAVKRHHHDSRPTASAPAELH